MRFRIFGNGAFGVALSKIFHKNMLIEDSFAEQFAPIVAGDIVIPAVPSDVCVEVLKKVLGFGKPEAIMLVSKGLASNRLLSVDCQESIKCDVPLLFFAGPNLAKEIEYDTSFLSATIAGPGEITSKIKQFLDDMIIDETPDLIIAQVAAVMKNVTAFVIGYLELTENARATLIMEGMKEALLLAKALGSNQQDTLRGCFGDFVLTCTSENSRNFQAGRAHRTKTVQCVTQESLKSIDNIYALKGELKLPIVDFFYNLVKFGEGKLDLLSK